MLWHITSCQMDIERFVAIIQLQFREIARNMIWKNIEISSADSSKVSVSFVKTEISILIRENPPFFCFIQIQPTIDKQISVDPRDRCAAIKCLL